MLDWLAHLIWDRVCVDHGPFRTQGGLICKPENLFQEICYEIGIKELIAQGYLSKITARAGQARADLDHLHIRAGEFVAEDVEKAMGEESVVETACREIVYCSLLMTNGRRSIVSPELTAAGFQVERGKHGNEKLKVPVLYSLNNHIEKFFDADAVSFPSRIVLEVEAGRAIDNNQFLKDIFQASMMYGIDYLAIAVRNDYRGKDDFSKIFNFLETLYINGRLQLPLKGILLIGY